MVQGYGAGRDVLEEEITTIKHCETSDQVLKAVL